MKEIKAKSIQKFIHKAVEIVSADIRSEDYEDNEIGADGTDTFLFNGVAYKVNVTAWWEKFSWNEWSIENLSTGVKYKWNDQKQKISD